ncbi:hypothetical protein SAM23877_4804 [Streptomyces ambofaciens ATCC 23877]|uniref:Uncharacterized protein n=2 Tax=Streptomyces ambofaciens TaxID=1889 RepID=A0A0K2AXU0_STRA7|nr:hypothetical protein [Streptomyces ambofaciens]AKZ57849.1 hypothetical protein SAM23877_4804 [Streptomyces ambofaciens ATCC 23877]ANB08281.1 hypothetical protein SAM40697_4323 [Streptomyces ambofaciens]
MEQRRGSTSQPLEGAGFDPAFIPGLTAPVTRGPQDARADEPAAESGTGAEEVRDAEEAPVGDPSVAEPTGESAEPSAEPDEEAPDGPVFEASDRRARIVADHKGVRLSLDDQSCEFRWDEVGAVETETGRFGKRFTVTVHTPDRRWYPIEIEAKSRSRFPEWESALDEVLDAYFEDDAGSDAKSGAQDEAGPDEKPGARDDAASEAKSDAQKGAEGKADGDE